MRFENRADAGRKLAAKLDAYRDTRPLILAIPRGGVPLGREVADALHGELDVVLVRKLGAPYNPEFAVGSVGESGKVIVADYAARVGAGEQYLAEEAERQLALIRKRRAQYASLHTSVSAKGRTVIVVDDGLATGATMRAALDEIRSQNPARLVCAVPVAAPNAAAYVRPFCDEWVFLAVEPDFDSVGWFYRDFRQVEDEEAVALLAQSGNPAG